MSAFNDPERPDDLTARPLPPARPRVRKVSATQPDSASLSAPVLHRTSSYQVGYGKPPKETRFKPGQSGNPKGRPKGAKGLHTIAREILTERIPVKKPNGSIGKMTRMEAIFQKLLEAAAKGNAKAMEQLMKLYLAAVPDIAPEMAPVETAAAEDISPTDLVILEEYLRAQRSSKGAPL